MSIDETYGLPPIPLSVQIPLSQFPSTIQSTLTAALAPLSHCWRGIETDAFRQNGVALLRVTLDVGDRPLHLLVHEDGDAFQIDAPVYFDFPLRASPYVLSELCGTNVYLSFRLDKVLYNVHGTQKYAATTQPLARDVLYGWGRFDGSTFVRDAPTLLPYLITKLTAAELSLRHFLDGSPPALELAA